MSTMEQDDLKRLHTILIGMDIPNHRLDTSKDENLRWLSRNILINNADHPGVDEAVTIISKQLKTRSM